MWGRQLAAAARSRGIFGLTTKQKSRYHKWARCRGSEPETAPFIKVFTEELRSFLANAARSRGIFGLTTKQKSRYHKWYLLFWRDVRDQNPKLRLLLRSLLRSCAVYCHLCGAKVTRGSSVLRSNKKDEYHLWYSSFLARRKGLEPLTFWFVAKHSIQLS